MRSLAFKLFTLLLTLFLLLSFSAPAFALPIRYWLAVQDLDEHPVPHAMAARYFIIPLGWSGSYLVIFQIKRKASTVSEEVSTTKPSDSPRIDAEIR